MKGTIFLRPLEYNIIADGEKWRQGEKIKGQLKVRNHGAEAIELPLLKILLAVGNFKKIKAKDDKALEFLSGAVLCENIALLPGEEKEFYWDFVLPEDCPITDKTGSLFLAFQDKKEGPPAGQLELVIEPKLVMQQFLEIFENFLRFKVVQRKFSKGMVEVKLNPPNSRELSHVESLVLRMKEVGKTLDLEYNFNVQVFETVAGNVIAQKKCKLIKQQLTAKQYYIYGDSPNHEFIQASIASVIQDATPKLFLQE